MKYKNDMGIKNQAFFDLNNLFANINLLSNVLNF